MIGKIIDHQAKQITFNAYSYYKKRKLDKSTYEHKEDINLIDTVSEVTGLSKSTVTRIIREGNIMLAEEGVANFKPQEKKKHIRKKRILIDEITEGIIRRKVIQFYTVKNEVPSVRRLNALLKEEKILKCSDEYLRCLLHKLGFTNAENDSTGMLRERSDIVSQRLAYLQAIKNFRSQGRDIFFLNETKLWAQQDNDDTPINIPKNMPSFVIVFVSGNTGFLNGALLMMKAKSKIEDEDDKNFEHFKNYDWMKDTVLRNIPPRSIVVMNTPICETNTSSLQDEKPTTASTRASIETWLNNHNISFQETARKSELCELIKKYEELMKYSLSKLIVQKGHEVLHLPKNHSDLNPAFLVWEELKEFSETRSSPMKLINNYPKDKWEEKFKHVRENEAEYYEHDIKADDADHILQLKKEKEDDDNVKPKSESETENSMDCDY